MRNSIKKAVLAAAAFAVAAVGFAAPGQAIVNGKDVSLQDRPYLLSMHNPKKMEKILAKGKAPGEAFFDSAYCSASLIAPRVAVTAAHCVLAPDLQSYPDLKLNIDDKPGDIILSHTQNLLDGTVEASAKSVTVIASPILMEAMNKGLEKYKKAGSLEEIMKMEMKPKKKGAPRMVTPDLAIIILDRDIPGTEPIALPDINDSTVDASGKRVGIMGWGTQAWDKKTYGTKPSAALKGAETIILPDSVCGVGKQKPYRVNGRTINPTPGHRGIPDREICAGGGLDEKKRAVSECQGDSGGPLVSVEKNQIIGVVSWGDGCGTLGYPGYFTKLRPQVPWLLDVIKQHAHHAGMDHTETDHAKRKRQLPQ